MNATARAASVIVAGALALACSRDESDKPPVRVVELPTRANWQAIPSPSPPPVGRPDAAGAGRDDRIPWPGDVDAAPAAPQASAVRAPVTAAKPRNPDDATLDQARVAAGGCFASLPAGPGYGPPQRSAHIAFTVIPTGTVSRAEVSSGDTDDPGVLDCLRERARSTVFSDNNGGPLRTYAIDVQVFAPGSSGAH